MSVLGIRVTAHLKDFNRIHKGIMRTISFCDNKWFRDPLDKSSQVTGGEATQPRCRSTPVGQCPGRP
jgi:hypothetical protein